MGLSIFLKAKPVRLQFFIFFSALLISFVSFATVLAVTSFVFLQVVENNATRTAQTLSAQIYQSIPPLMQRGWRRGEFNKLFNPPYQGSNAPVYSVKLYLNDVGRQDGRAFERCNDQLARAVFQSGRMQQRQDDCSLETYYPLRAGEVCVGCHPRAHTGDVLGAVSIRHNIEPMMQEAKRNLLGIFLVLSPLPFGMTFMLSRFMNRRVTNAINHLHSQVIKVNSVDDLSRLQHLDFTPGFVELEQIFQEVGKLADKIQSISVDKDILEFEIQILEKFIITSEMVRDWKEHICKLLLEINKVLDVCTIFCIFHTEERLDVEVFWRCKPTESTRLAVEGLLMQKVKAAGDAGDKLVHVEHTVAKREGTCPDLDCAAFELQTKSLILETPQIGGVVGIGVQSELVRDDIRSLVIDSILTTLLNVVGSIKAIYKYTHDLEYYATRDPLTNLYNQRAFWEFLHYELNRADRHDYRLALLVIDLDNFKNINDTWGHTVGDQYLTAFANKVHDVLRKGDSFSRYGGDEFVVILPEADQEQAYMVANRVREAVEELYIEAPDGAKPKATVSIGMAVYPTHAQNEKDLFLFADNMAYKAKDQGKNRVLVPREEDVLEVFQKAGENARLVMDAIEEGLFTPYFQPIAPIGPEKEEACEVLCRIERNGEVIPAGEFIEIAENLGVVSKLDLIVLEKAFAEVVRVDYRGYLFVNLSPKCIILQEFIPAIITMARRYGIPHEKIVFELTERETVKNISLLEQFVRELKFQGFKFAIDDFGSGYSSFQYIRRFPIDFVKIEGVFVQNMLSNAKDLAFVKTLAILAREFGISTIAEYVESREILAALEEMEIDYAQGYYIGTPSPDLQAVCQSATARITFP
ncbi:putative bifunctional diguanylate cyclase/phosphodiesterase [Geomesophilobacter sediminis]|uniref:Bifunctional diguanylate cyclase/phosphodiesterase n=1 Tax=Geomesophilobacter sediminis TaxID=2798584 RepID=A0A8J7LYY8_9BACT|nr:bifunctional diguanylate cyclase/phosphodiesterase [Geomesophilobacter sediminis]MBJ6725752.1 bifunctional diguanylate cyclase/phosphodiesterase [Geomesophilobacter sediminis]